MCWDFLVGFCFLRALWFCFIFFFFLVGEPVTFQSSTFAVWSLRKKNRGPVSALSLRIRLPSSRRHKKANLISQQHKDTNYSKARPCKIKPTIKSKRLESGDPISDYPRSPTEALPRLELPGHVHYFLPRTIKPKQDHPWGILSTNAKRL